MSERETELRPFIFGKDGASQRLATLLLREAISYGDTGDDPVEQYVRLAAGKRNYGLFRQAVLLGGASLYEASIETEASASIFAMGIFEEHRRQGYGKQLLDGLEAHVGLLGVQIMATIPTAESAAFFEHRGYINLPEGTDYYVKPLPPLEEK